VVLRLAAKGDCEILIDIHIPNIIKNSLLFQHSLLHANHFPTNDSSVTAVSDYGNIYEAGAAGPFNVGGWVQYALWKIGRTIV